MNSSKNLYKRHRFPPAIIQYAVWLYHRFNLSYRDIEDLLAERGIEVSYESIRLWCNKFGPNYAKRLRCKHRGFGDTFFIDEVFVKIDGKAANSRDKGRPSRFDSRMVEYWKGRGRCRRYGNIVSWCFAVSSVLL